VNHRALGEFDKSDCRSDDWMALFISLSLITFGTLGINDGPFLLAEQYSAIWLPVHLLGVFSTASLVLFFFLFPNGRFVPRWTRWMAVLWVAHEVAYYFFPDSLLDLDSSFPQIDFMVMVTFAGVGASSLLYRYRRVSGPIQRQQTKWVVFGTAVALLGAVGFKSISYVLPPTFQEGSLYALIIEAVVFGSLLLIPLSVGVAILRYRLWDIDHIINRALVYSILIRYAKPRLLRRRDTAAGDIPRAHWRTVGVGRIRFNASHRWSVRTPPTSHP
jgi:hypothetical protein